MRLPARPYLRLDHPQQTLTVPVLTCEIISVTCLDDPEKSFFLGNIGMDLCVDAFIGHWLKVLKRVLFNRSLGAHKIIRTVWLSGRR